MLKIKGILLIDDDFINNFVNHGIIAKLGLSKEITDLTDGNSAIGYLEDLVANSKACPEIILLDIEMPILDGFEFMEQFNKLSFLNSDKIQVIVLTSSNSPKDIERMKDLGIKNFITKPLTEEKFLKVLEDKFVTILNSNQF